MIRLQIIKDDGHIMSHVSQYTFKDDNNVILFFVKGAHIILCLRKHLTVLWKALV